MNTITVQTTVNAPLEKVWEYWTKPEHIVNWAFASDDWAAPEAENDVRAGGNFRTRMEARDKSEGFDFTGVYTAVVPNELIEYDMDDPSPESTSSPQAGSGQARRHVKTEFAQTPEGVKIVQTFDPESENPEELQRAGWQAILENFKKYTEDK